MPKRTSRISSVATLRSAGTLINWHEPEANASVLDWRERAHEFGLVPVDDHGALDERPVVEPPERLIEEEEQEAFDDQLKPTNNRWTMTRSRKRRKRGCRRRNSISSASTSSTSAGRNC